MAILTIRKFGDPALRQRAQEIEKVTGVQRRLIEDMLQTIREGDSPGVGLAGPQVGVLERVFVFDTEERSGALINPVIVERSTDTIEEEEGCLSIPGIYMPVVRHQQVKVEGIDESGAEVSFEASDLLARICQHEIDHLDGVLFIDRLTEERRKEALSMLRDQALGLPIQTRASPPAEERL